MSLLCDPADAQAWYCERSVNACSRDVDISVTTNELTAWNQSQSWSLDWLIGIVTAYWSNDVFAWFLDDYLRTKKAHQAIIIGYVIRTQLSLCLPRLAINSQTTLCWICHYCRPGAINTPINAESCRQPDRVWCQWARSDARRVAAPELRNAQPCRGDTLFIDGNSYFILHLGWSNKHRPVYINVWRCWYFMWQKRMRS